MGHFFNGKNTIPHARASDGLARDVRNNKILIETLK